MSSGKRRALFVVWVLCMLFLLWSPPAKDRFGYWLPIALIAASAVGQGIGFIASRLERTDVTSVELAARRFLFKPDPASRNRRTPP